jgi:O-antigen/teichoic acid export membrane protein
MVNIAFPTISPSSTGSKMSTLFRSDARLWVSKGFFAIVDQGFISGSNFAMGILLARWLGAAQYGAYALAFAIFVLLSLVYQSLLLEPMSVFGPSLYRDRLRAYTGTLVWIHIVIASGTFAVMGIAAWAMGYFPRFCGLAPALMGASIAAPCVLLFWLARRAYYLKLASSQAAVGGVLYSALLFGTLAILHHLNMISAMMAFVVMAIAALAASIYLLLRFRPQLRWRNKPSLQRVCRENWSYGRWALASAVFMWVPWNIFYTLVASFSGMADAGQLRALLNFALPMAQTFGAFSLLLLPHAACTLEEKGTNGVRTISGQITLLFLVGSLIYWVPVCVFRHELLQVLYAGQYGTVAAYIPWIGLASVLWGAAQGPAIALRAQKSPHAVFVMYLVSSIVALVVGVPATFYYGLPGAVSAMLLASASAWVTGTFCIGNMSYLPITKLGQAA